MRGPPAIRKPAQIFRLRLGTTAQSQQDEGVSTFLDPYYSIDAQLVINYAKSFHIIVIYLRNKA